MIRCALFGHLSGYRTRTAIFPPATAYTCAESRHRSARFHRRSSTTVVVLSFIVAIGLATSAICTRRS